MITLNQKTFLPQAVSWYTLTKLLILLGAVTFLFSLAGAGMFALGTFGFFIIFPIAIYFLLYYSTFSFSVDESKITINSGIIVHRSKSIPLNNIQNINDVSGLLMRMFGLTRMAIWTASASQIEIHNENSDNRPDGVLFLLNADGDWLKDYMLKKK